MSLVEKCAEDGGCRPVRELNTKVEIHETTLYGKNEDGLTYKIKDCLTRKALWVFITSTSFIIFAGFVTVNTMWADTRDYPETKKQVQANTLDIVALKAKQDAIYNLLVAVDRKLDKKEESKKVDPEKEE